VNPSNFQFRVILNISFSAAAAAAGTGSPMLALKWYRHRGNIQAEIEDMQEEQRSLSSVQSVSVLGMLFDRSVRWQVLTIIVFNIGMQLSGIDAVRSRERECVCLKV